MSRKASVRSIVVFCFLGLAAVILLLSVPLAWKQWRGYAAARASLASRSEGDRSLVSIRDQMTDLEGRKTLISLQTAENGAALERLEKKLMPMEAAASRLLKLDLLNLAADCGLVVEEMRPVQIDGRSRDPENPTQVDSGQRVASGEAGAIAFLGKFPAGEAYRRPVVSLQCRAQYDQVHRFLEDLKGLRWQVTPVAFSIGRANVATPPVAYPDGEAPDSTAPVRWSAGDDLLHLTVVLAM